MYFYYYYYYYYYNLLLLLFLLLMLSARNSRHITRYEPNIITLMKSCESRKAPLINAGERRNVCLGVGMCD